MNDERHSGDAEAARIRDDIEETRADLSGTIGELQDKLRPEHLMQKAGGAVRDKVEGKMRDAKRSARALADEVQDHPVGAAMAVAAAGALLWARSRAHEERRYPAYGYERRYERRYDGYGGRAESRSGMGPGMFLLLGAAGYYLFARGDQNGHRMTERANRAKATMEQATDRAWHTAEDLGTRASSAAKEYSDRATEQVRQFGASARTHLKEAADMMLEQTEGMSERIDRWMAANPLSVGIAALALGAIAGLSLPRSEAEDRTLGVARDRLMDKAGQAMSAALGANGAQA